MEDRDIIQLYWQRKEEAIAATAEKYGSFCHSISYRILGSHQDAEECVNDAWLGAWRSIPPQRPDPLSTYLGKIVRNLSLNRFKRYSTQKRGKGQTLLVLSELDDCIPDENGLEQMVERHILAEAIQRFLQAQPEQKRSIFIRRYWHLYPIREIAAVFGFSESKIASILLRMRRELKKHLQKEGIGL